ncbi:MAG: D-alanine--D-alanine ligase [Firmicutes bacterium]|nr:D-alanine--D-alanine ligase [Bacillota bacterium]
MSKFRLGILFGGKSSEHEVSLRSATAVIENADKTKYDIVMIGITKEGRWLLYDGDVKHLADGSWQQLAEKALAEDPVKYGFCVFGTGSRQLKDMVDFIFPVMHGQNAEDGSIQGLLQLADIPYAGCGITGSALCMDKCFAKQICDACGIPQTPYVTLTAADLTGMETVVPNSPYASRVHDRLSEKLSEINEKLRYPLFVKPANMGSSVGISKVDRPEDLQAALQLAASYDSRIVVEQGVQGRELEVAVMGNRHVFACEVGEIKAAETFYSYDAKYNNAQSQTIVGAKLSPDKMSRIRSLAERAYSVLGCEGFARVDFFLDEEGNFLLNEINTLPGFTSISMFPMLAQAYGFTYAELIDKIVELGLERFKERSTLKI